ncbi:MAG: T9SS type A sorting domain-containing protein [Candidatus Zixiibacteriota bacterium]
MSKRLMVASILCLAVVFLFSSTVLAKVKIEDAMKWEVLADPASPQMDGVGIPLNPGIILASPGTQVGTTHYDYQTNGSTGNRVALDDLGGVHLLWMNGINAWSGNRWIYYNFRDENGNWGWPGVGIVVNTTQGAGYTNVSVLDDGRAVAAYHSVGNGLYNAIAIDLVRGFGSFTEIDAPECPTAFYYVWPYMTIDRSGRIHIVDTENPGTGVPQQVCYTNSADEGNTWSNPVLCDTLMDISAVLTSSRVSDKVAIAFTHPRDLVTPNQYNNDMCYYESLDGVTWNFNGGMVNVTNYQFADTLRAYTDCDAVYDYNDNLHLLWNTPYYDEAGGFISVDRCLLWHWSQATGITMVANTWWASTPGAWNRSSSKMSLGVDENNNVFALWTQFTNNDNSVGGFSNGELYISYSTDGGATWSASENVTNSPTPDCWPLECDSDHWSTLAEQVDDNLHITYINDKDAGGIPQTEGVDTENPVMYLEVANPVSGVSMSCQAITPVFCQGKHFYFSVTVNNSTGGNVSGQLSFVGYASYDCDPANTLVTIPKAKSYPPGLTVEYYFFKVPAVPAGQYSASVGGTLSGYDLYCCMNVDIVSCVPWKVGDNTAWELVEVDRPEVELPTVTSLSQNYPNPFNANTNISYTLAEAGNVSLSVYDISGRLVAALVDGQKESGEHSATWNASEFSSGVYFYKLTTADYTATKKMHLLK